MKTKKRCRWCLGNDLYETYHDLEWGVPVYDDETLFEFLILETFQSGLSWITILKKRENFRAAFDQFNYSKIAKYTRKDLESLFVNKGIIRHKLKIKAAVSNAQAFQRIQLEFGSFSSYFWHFTDGVPLKTIKKDSEHILSNTPLSEKISKDLKIRGFKFVGSTTIYALMQATGVVNDHEVSCFRYNQLNSVGNNL